MQFYLIFYRSVTMIHPWFSSRLLEKLLGKFLRKRYDFPDKHLEESIVDHIQTDLMKRFYWILSSAPIIRSTIFYDFDLTLSYPKGIFLILIQQLVLKLIQNSICTSRVQKLESETYLQKSFKYVCRNFP